MDIRLFLLSFILYWKYSVVSATVWCFQCESRFTPHTSSSSVNNCEFFDSSNKYIQQCNSSTMCFKKKITIDLGNNLITTYQRGCASQTMSGDQKKINGKWTLVNNIYEVYKETCEEDVTTEFDRLTNSLHCYCRGDFCNTSTKISINSLLMTLSSIMIFKYK
ncbi:uncharacterized protein LOC131847074 [Achroia grisella]|uniref:uncharacterized protein LOC131847074 n=1 Tax=Achroia grisella TaxID=688607 RepID=UPI0027D245EC|nr:uncharacterized protein LOC131847074 [Achroia grisella]